MKELVLLVAVLTAVSANIVDLNPPPGICLCFTSSNVNIRATACGASFGVGNINNCYLSAGGKQECSLSGVTYQFFSFLFASQANICVTPSTGWSAGDFLRIGEDSECGRTDFPAGEFRSVFLTTAWNIDWPSVGSSPATQQSQLINYLNLLRDANFNAVVFQVRPAADALYSSNIEPWSRFLTGTQGTPPSPFWDPLAFIIHEAHARNIEVHTWLNPYRANVAGNYDGLAENHVANVHRQYAYIYGSSVYMDPGAQVVADWLKDVIVDIVRRYNVDGIHFDDYFYPYPIEGVEFPDDATYNTYVQGGGQLSRDDWRRDNINRMISDVYSAIKVTRRSCVFSISPFGIYRPGHPDGMPSPPIFGLDPYSALYADAKLWLEEGWLDVIAPQLYWAIDPPAQSYPYLLDWWLDRNPMHRHICVANAVNKMDGANDWPATEIAEQVDESRKTYRKARHSLGNILYSARFFRDNFKGIYSIFQHWVYEEPATVPPMDWLSFSEPSPPATLYTTEGRLHWSADTTGTVEKWVVYCLEEGTWRIVDQLVADVTSVEVAGGMYAIKGMNEARVLSDAVYVGVYDSRSLA